MGTRDVDWSGGREREKCRGRKLGTELELADGVADLASCILSMSSLGYGWL